MMATRGNSVVDWERSIGAGCSSSLRFSTMMQWRRGSSGSPRRVISSSSRSAASARTSERRGASSPRQQLARFVVAGLLLLLLESWWRSGPDNFEELENAHELEFYPAELLQDEHDVRYTQEISEADRVHLVRLHEGCMAHKDSVITWEFGKGSADDASEVGKIEKDDPKLMEKLGGDNCPDVEVFLPVGIRSDGYCEDAMGYVKYLNARILPLWVLETDFKDPKTGESLSYHDLCPRTPVIFMNHYWDGVTESASWPPSKPLYMMPNVEMFELKAEHYWSVDVVLCKTALCARRVRLWYQQEGNPRNTRVLYTRHTTSDPALSARQQLLDAGLKAKDFSDVRLVHTAGKSVEKGTRAVLDCWISRPDLPPVDIYVHQEVWTSNLKDTYEKALQEEEAAGHIKVHTGRVPADDFGKMMAEAAFLLCTSIQEGYGHYINQARANAAVIVSTDAPPMNELLSPESAVLVPHHRWAIDQQLLGGMYAGKHGLQGVKGMASFIKGADVCDAVDRILEMTPTEREAMGERARKQYVVDTNFFAARMQDLRKIARGGSPKWY